MSEEESIELNAAADVTWYGRIEHDFDMTMRAQG
jgi:hypothetical protein